MAWSEESEGLLNQVRGQLARITDDHTRAQTVAWVRAWDDVAPLLEAALNDLALGAVDGRIRRMDVIRSARLQNALDLIQGRLADLVDASADDVIASLADVVDYAGSMQERIITSQLPLGAAGEVAAWSRVSPAAVDAIVQRATEQITKTSFPLSDEATAIMRRQLVRGIAVGENPRKVAAAMVRKAERGFNGGLGRALTIARTEMLDAHRAAGALEDQTNAHLLTGWMWTATLSERTCRSCWSMHGREFPLDQPGPQDHQCGRCARVPKTKTWRDLGFDIDEPPSLMPNAADTFATLSPAQQRGVLGARGYDAWRDGDFPITEWATKRETPGWRDSWVPAKAPALV